MITIRQGAGKSHPAIRTGDADMGQPLTPDALAAVTECLAIIEMHEDETYQMFLDAVMAAAARGDPVDKFQPEALVRSIACDTANRVAASIRTRFGLPRYQSDIRT
jgi:hypothetical protein